MNKMTHYKSTDMQYYYENQGIQCDDWNEITKQTIIYGIYDMLSKCYPDKIEECFEKIISVIDLKNELEVRQCIGELRKNDNRFKKVGNLIDDNIDKGAFWRRAKYIKTIFPYKDARYWVYQVAHDYSEILETVWWTIAIEGGTTSKSEKSLKQYIKSINKVKCF